KVSTRSDPDARRSETIHHYGTLLQIDSRLNLGTSGGPVVDLRGELVGITTSLAALGGYEKSAGFAVPFDAPMKRVVEALANGHEVEYGFLGVRVANSRPEIVRALSESADHVSWAMVADVPPGSPASISRVQSNDIVLA